MPTPRSAVRLLLASVAAALFVAVVSGQEAVPPGEKNMFVGTPAGWKAPKTAWGDPDLRARISFVGGVPLLSRCARSPRVASGTAAARSEQGHTEEEFRAR
jgi:hypothetical protein